MASIFPDDVDLPSIIGQVEQLAQLLSEVAAERYAYKTFHQFILIDFLLDMP